MKKKYLNDIHFMPSKTFIFYRFWSFKALPKCNCPNRLIQ